MYDIIILGSGPAGLTAALYGARAGKKTLVLAGPELYGTLNKIPHLENYPGWLGSGPDLGKFMKDQATKFGAEIVSASVTKITSHEHESRITHHVLADNGTEYKSRTVIIATGAVPRKLDAKGVREFVGKGVSYCATCDGFFYQDKVALIIGGGNSAMNDALYMADHAKTVKILYRKDSFSRAEQTLVDKVMARENIECLFETELSEIAGDDSGVTHVITTNGVRIDCDGVFIAIGVEANTDYLCESCTRDDMGRLVAENLHTGMYVAGDVRSGIKMQVATAVGWGCEAAMDAIAYVNSL